MTPTDQDRAEAGLRALLHQHPGAVVGAIGPDGLFVPPPETLPLGDHARAQARSALDLVELPSRVALVRAWERLLAGESDPGVTVRALGGGTARWHCFDLTAHHGVCVGVLVPVDAGGMDLEHAATVVAPPPRFARARKDELAHLVEVDDATVAMLGWSREELLGKRTLDFIHPDEQEQIIDAWMEALANPGGTCRVRARHRHRDGHWLWIEIANHNLLEDPEVGAVDCEMIDISEEMAAHEALRGSEELLRRLAAALPVGVVQFDTDLQVVYANDRFYQILGLPPGSPQDLLLDCVVDPEALMAATTAVLAGEDVDVDLAVDRADGTGRRHCTIAYRSLADKDGHVVGAVGCISDVTEASLLRGELEVRATFDALTGCVNRATIMATLTQAMAAPGAGVVAAFVDLDQFKVVNDELGHAVGDILLVAVAARMHDAVRAGDVVGRLGGDEFLAVCHDVADTEAASAMGDRISAAINGPIDIGGHRVHVRASVGVAWVGPGERCVDAEVVIARADAAMYSSKRTGDGTPMLASPGADHRPIRTGSTVDLGDSLRRAMEQHQLAVHYQPVISLTSRALVGFEALLRWNRDGRLVPAGEFIEAAETTGLICEVGPWVIDEVCRQAVASHRTDLTWFVNLSPRELAAPRTIGAIGRALDRHGMPAVSLVVEITEHAALADGGIASGVVAQLDRLGVAAAIDDFGTGWSSLASLLEVPVAWLKIDRRFIQASRTPKGRAIVAGVVDLARRLGVHTVAEGIETDEELAAAIELGAEFGQGYGLGRPGPLDEVLDAATGATSTSSGAPRSR